MELVLAIHPNPPQEEAHAKDSKAKQSMFLSLSALHKGFKSSSIICFDFQIHSCPTKAKAGAGQAPCEGMRF